MISKRSAPMFALLCMMVGLLATGSAASQEKPAAPKSGFRQPNPNAQPELFVWTDTCNVYVLRDGDAALLIDLGDGSVLEHLADIGVKRVEWVLLTHHHREQCQGIERIDRTVTRVAGPKAEQVKRIPAAPSPSAYVTRSRNLVKSCGGISALLPRSTAKESSSKLTSWASGQSVANASAMGCMATVTA